MSLLIFVAKVLFSGFWTHRSSSSTPLSANLGWQRGLRRPGAHKRHSRCINSQFHRYVLPVVVSRPLGRGRQFRGTNRTFPGHPLDDTDKEADKLDIQTTYPGTQLSPASTKLATGAGSPASYDGQVDKLPVPNHALAARIRENGFSESRLAAVVGVDVKTVGR